MIDDDKNLIGFGDVGDVDTRTLCSRFYCGFLDYQGIHDMYINITATVTRNATSVTLSNISCYLYLDWGTVPFASARTRTWGLKNADKTVNNLVSVYYGMSFTNQTFALPAMTFPLSASATSTTLYVSGPDGDFGFTLSNIPTGYTAPQGLRVSVIVSQADGAQFNAALDSWGTDNGTVSDRYMRVIVSPESTAMTRPWVYKDGIHWAITTIHEDDIAVTNNIYDAKDFEIQPNTRYYYGAWCINTMGLTAQTGTSTFITLPGALKSVTASVIDATTATIYYTTNQDGGAVRKNILYSLDGTNYTIAATVDASSEITGSFNIDIPAGQTTKVYVRIGGVGTGYGAVSTVTISSGPNAAFYGSVDDLSKRIDKLYGSELVDDNEVVDYDVVIDSLRWNMDIPRFNGVRFAKYIKENYPTMATMDDPIVWMEITDDVTCGVTIETQGHRVGMLSFGDDIPVDMGITFKRTWSGGHCLCTLTPISASEGISRRVEKLYGSHNGRTALVFASKPEPSPKMPMGS